jgi:WD40 repeat protein
VSSADASAYVHLLQVESLANITELHEPLALDGSMAPGAGSNRAAFEGDDEYDSWRGRDFGIWSIAWSPQGGQLIAGGRSVVSLCIVVIGYRYLGAVHAASEAIA